MRRPEPTCVECGSPADPDTLLCEGRTPLYEEEE